MDETELSNAWRDMYASQLDSGGGGLNFNGFGSALTGLAQVWGGVEIAKSKASVPSYQVGPNGMVYREGVPVSQGLSSAGGISPLMLLILAGVAIFALKD